jgi:hypothetical protein
MDGNLVMRSIVIAVLLGGIAAPAVAAGAQPHFAVDPRDERPAPARHGQARAEEAERQDFAEPAERRQIATERSQSRRARAQWQARSQGPAGPAGGSFDSPSSADDFSNAPSEHADPRGFDSVRDWRADERRRADSPAIVQDRNLRRSPSGIATGGFVEQRRPLPPVLDRNDRRVTGTTPVLGAEPPSRASAGFAQARPSQWRTDWRRDRRFDWYDHRRRHRSLFHFGFYYDPFGWSYRRHAIGWRLWPSYYSSRYWMHDPSMFRLPRAYGPYRWIRYWDDALLVDLHTGEVVDVIHDFFW